MKRIPQLDGIRGVAVTLILFHHYVVNQVQAASPGLLDHFLRSLSLTWCGVDLFFVLSGFLIAGILLDNLQATNYFKVFYIRRICRIFPLYYALLVMFVVLPWVVPRVTSACRWLFDDPMPLWSYAMFTQNIFMSLTKSSGAKWLAITWSLAVEEQFYLILPLVIFLVPRRVLPWLFSFFIILAPLLRHWLPGMGAYVNTPLRADSLLAGSLLAYCVREPAINAIFEKNVRILYVVFCVLLLGAAALAWHVAAPGGAITHFWLAALFAVTMLLALIHEAGWLSRILRNGILVWLGGLSYGIYMFHQAVNGLLHGLICDSSPKITNLKDATVTLVALVVTISLAAFSYALFEKRIIQFGHSFRYENREARCCVVAGGVAAKAVAAEIPDKMSQPKA